MTPSVVITRPRAQGEELAVRVRALGREAIVLPLLEILPLPDQAALRAGLARLTDYALVAFVSPNAIAAAFTAQPDWPASVPLAVVGEGSRKALIEHGIDAARTRIYSPRNVERTDSETLLAELDLAALRGRKVLIIRGETGRELLGDALRAAGIDVTQLAAYRRAAPQLDLAGLARLAGLLAGRHDWVVTSSEALRTMAALARELKAEAGLRAQRLIVPHIRIRETAEELGLNDLVLTGSGDEHMLAALQS